MDEIILKAIKEKKLIEFVYHGYIRIAEPHIYGMLNGKEQILIFQIGGQSSTGNLPNWRRVQIDQISKLRMLDENFAGKRENPSGEHSVWDKYYVIVS